MATNTVIIESNRKIAYKEELDSIEVPGIGNVTRQERIPNNRWTTHIPSGLEVNVGDQINLEAAMINSVGGGDSVMEFIGKGGNGGTDRQMDIDVSFYITNNQQFNFNLPMWGMKIIYEIYTDAFGTPDFVGESSQPDATPVKQYNQFKKSYPLEGLTGYSVTAGPAANPPPTTLLPQTAISMGSYDSHEISPLRYYYSQKWSGGYIDPTASGDAPYLKFTKPIKLSAPLGFSPPSAVGERLTSQLHAREGNADSWSFSTVNPTKFFLAGVAPNGILKQKPLPGVTDQSYLTIPTSNGALLYGRLTGDWSARLKNEAGHTEGDGYLPDQGRRIFWSNMLCGNPEEALACDILKKVTSRPQLVQNITLDNINQCHIDTGTREKYTTTNGVVGEYGNRMCLFHDDLPSVKKTLLRWIQTTTDTATNFIPTGFTGIFWNVLSIPKNYAIVSNVVWNDVTTNLMNDAFDAFHSCDADAGLINTDDPDYLDKFFVRWKFGRKDDEATRPSISQKHYLTNAKLNDDGPSNDLYEKVVWNVQAGSVTPVPTGAQECSYMDKAARNPSDASLTLHRPCLPGLIANGQDGDGNSGHLYDYYIYFKYYADLRWSPIKAQEGLLDVIGLRPQTAAAGFTTVHPNGLDAQLKVWAAMGNAPGTVRYGYIPVYKVPSGSPDSAASPIPYIAFVTQTVTDPDNLPIPKPVLGEYMGLSPSMNDNLFSKPVNVQKYTAAGAAYDVSLNDTVDYYPYCHIGANDPLISFGDNGRFQISQFHTPIRTGNGTFNLPNYPAAQQPETVIATVGSSQANVSGVKSNGAIPPTVVPQPFYDVIQSSEGNNPIISAQSGMSLERLLNYTQDLSGKNVIKNYDTRAYQNTLFFKLGFSVEQLLPIFGLPQNDFNRGNYNQYLGTSRPAGLKLVNMVKPFTTNAYISAAIIPSMITGAGFVQNTANPPVVVSRPQVPMPLLGGLDESESNTNIESDVLIAIRMPHKLDYPYLVVYTDIVRDAQYIGGPSGHQNLSAIAYITRNYSAGDFFYAFSTGWTYTADSNYTITSITTDIRMPDGSIAPLDDNSSVIYKLIKMKQMPLDPALIPKILAVEQKLEEKEAKATKKS
tara:strand:- start:234 stop:3545 length:3312 start_codon:yes stop_codon:yes gene_type:complete